MNEILISKLEALAGDSLMLQALQEIFNERIKKEYPVVDAYDTDEQLGQRYRAYMMAKKILDGAMVDISSYSNQGNKSNNINKGR